MSKLEGRILVTGGAGFIGSALVWALNQRGLTDIVIADFLGSDEKWRNLVPLKFTDYVEANVFRERVGTRADALGRFTTVFHLGACSATTERNAAYLIDNNYTFTKELATWALAQDARFVYASSAATYGDGAAGMEDTRPDLDRLRPLNMYGYSKHLFDLYAQRLDPARSRQPPTRQGLVHTQGLARQQSVEAFRGAGRRRCRCRGLSRGGGWR